jgi:gas vesicle protein
MEDSGNGSYGWFAAGAVLGAAIALLFAPKSGQDTRKLIGKKADRSVEALEETKRDLMEKSKDLYDRGRKIADEAAELFERGRDLVRG